MIIKFVGKNVAFSPAMRDFTEDRLKRLEKYFVITDETEVRVVVKTYSYSQKVEITIPTKFGTLRAEKNASDYYDSVNLAMDVLEGQIRKLKTRIMRKHKDSLTQSFIDEETGTTVLSVVREKRIPLETMSVDEAVTRMLLTDHTFFMFVNEDNNDVSIVYSRADGTYGLLTGVR